MKNAYLSDVFTTLDRVASEYERDIGPLNSEQLNWKPNPKSWSVGQCVDHVITTNNLYFTIFESLLNRTKQFNFWEKNTFFTGLFW